jgi:hypothetical protein
MPSGLHLPHVDQRELGLHSGRSLVRWEMPVSPWWILAGLLAGCSGARPAEPREVCGDGVDNDLNGLTDCADRDCAGQAACIAPDFGTCAKCSQACTAQASCVGSYLDDRPIPLCVRGVCTALEKFIQPRVELDTHANWGGLTISPQSASTRFIKKVGNDGQAVTCATVAAVAADRTAPSAIEASGNLVVQGLDVTRISSPNLGQGLAFSLVNTQTGGDYLIWVELWSGPPSSANKMPTGRRYGFGCFEDPSQTQPLTEQDNCPSSVSDAGSCKVFRLVMPAPEP